MTTTEWKPHRLDDLGFVGRGKSRHRPRNDDRLYGGSYPFVQTAEIMAADPYITSYAQTYSEFGFQQSKMWPPDTLCMTIAGANTAKTAILKIEACFPDSVVGFIPDKSKADLHFIKYSLDLMRHRFLAVTRGATQDNLSLDKLLSFPISAPCVDQQRRIGAILSAYDELMDHNRRRIRLLETMSRTLYREWFIRFLFPGHQKLKRVASSLGDIPQDWEVKKLADVADVNRAQINARNAPEELHYIDISSVSPGQIDTITTYTFADAPGRARRIVQHGDVLWSCVRPNRRSHAQVIQPEPNTIASTGFAVLTATRVPFTFLYFATTTDDFVGYLTNNATGAAYPAVTAPTFEKADLPIPPAPLLKKFGEVTIPMAEQIHILQCQIQNLRRTRDLLLPRLLSEQTELPKMKQHGGSDASPR